MSTHDEAGRTQRPGNRNRDMDAPGKKSYSSPKLVVYGDVRAITQMIGNMGMNDGGTMNMKRTST